VLPHEGQLPLSLHGLKQLVRDNFRAHAAAAQQQQQQGTSSSQQQLSPLDQGFAALRALPQQVYLEACSSSYVTEGVLIEATSCYNPGADPYAAAGFITGGSSSSPGEQWFSYRIRVTNNRDHCIKVLGRGWVISSALGELQGYVQLAVNSIVGQQPVIPPGACFEYYSCSSLKRAIGPGSMKGHLLVSLLGPADQDDEQQEPVEDTAAAAVTSQGDASGAWQQEDSSSSRRSAAVGEEVELERMAMPVGEFKLQSPATAAAAVEAARAAVHAGSSSAGSSAGASQEEQQGGVAAAGEAAAEQGSISISRDAGSGSDSSSSDDEGSRR
jgi:uncharacterized protein affecting Mg2+/Co2+ transport